VVACYECSDEPSSSGATDLVSKTVTDDEQCPTHKESKLPKTYIGKLSLASICIRIINHYSIIHIV
jgi:hypothetical protein